MVWVVEECPICHSSFAGVCTRCWGRRRPPPEPQPETPTVSEAQPSLQAASPAPEAAASPNVAQNRGESAQLPPPLPLGKREEAIVGWPSDLLTAPWPT